MENTSAFKFFIFSPRDSNPVVHPLVKETYGMWREVWLAALGELEGATDLKSDDYTRQEQVGALLYEDEVVGSVFFTRVDLSDPMWRKDSYFAAWPEETMLEWGEKRPGFQLMVCSWFTLSPKMRRNATGLSAKQLLTSLSTQHMLRTDGCSGMLGTMRNNRGMNTVTYNVNATPILTDLQMHGVGVDLVIFDKETINAAPKGALMLEAAEIYDRSQELWTEMTTTQKRRLKLAA